MIEYTIRETGLVLDEMQLNEYAAEGWRLCQLIDRPLTSTGNRVLYHYIFERETSE